jgi:hypothetical protein
MYLLHRRYCPLLKRMQLTFKTRDDDWGNVIDRVKNMSLYYCMSFFSIGRYLSGISFIIDLK